LFNLIQFILFCIAQNHKLSSELYNLYTYNIPVSGPHIGSEKTPKKQKKLFHRGKKGNKPPGEQQRRIPLPG